MYLPNEIWILGNDLKTMSTNCLSGVLEREVQKEPQVPFKREKRYLRACYKPSCFHPAHSAIMLGDKTLWACPCHDPIEPKECHSTKVEKERNNFLTDGDCIFCGHPHSRNPMMGLEGKVVFVCDNHIVTPISELRRYYKHRE
jgi:hypothetical protein